MQQPCEHQRLLVRKVAGLGGRAAGRRVADGYLHCPGRRLRCAADEGAGQSWRGDSLARELLLRRAHSRPKRCRAASSHTSSDHRCLTRRPPPHRPRRGQTPAIASRVDSMAGGPSCTAAAHLRRSSVVQHNPGVSAAKPCHRHRQLRLHIVRYARSPPRRKWGGRALADIHAAARWLDGSARWWLVTSMVPRRTDERGVAGASR